MKEKLVYQSQAKGCGYAAIKMALIYASGRKDFAYAEEPPIQSQAPSIADLVLYAETHGLTLSAYRVKKAEELLHNHEYPLLLVLKEDRLTHLVYLRKRGKREYFVYDPAKGKRRIPFEELHRNFTGIFLTLRGYAEKNEPHKKKRGIHPFFKGVDAVSSLLPSLCLLSGLFCLDYGLLPVSIALMTASVISSLGARALKLAELRYFDRYFGYRLLEEDKGKRKELYTHFCAYKGLAFTCFGALLSSFFELTAALVIFSLRNPFFGLALLFALLLGTAVKIFDEPREKKATSALERKEKDFLEGEYSEDERKIALLSLFASSSSFASSLLLKEGFSLAVSIALSAITMAISGFYSFETFVYYSLAIIMVFHLLSSCFSAVEKMEEKEREEPYFLFHFLP